MKTRAGSSGSGSDPQGAQLCIGLHIGWVCRPGSADGPALAQSVCMNKLILLIPLLAAGCIGTNPRNEYQNHNNGTLKVLSFRAYPVTAAGDPVRLDVYRGEEGNYDCATYPNWLFGGTYEQCHYNDRLSPIEAITEAKADGCMVAIAGAGVGVDVTRPTAGACNVNVTVRLADGKALTDSRTVFFSEVEGIELTCARGWACPGPNAIFVGSTFSWKVSPSGKGGSLNGKIALTAEPAGIVELTPTPGEFTARALSPGVVTIRARSGTVERTLKLRVVAIEEVVAGSVRKLGKWSCDPVCDDADQDRVGDVIPQSSALSSPHLIVVWTTLDGTLVLGGAGRVRTSTPDAQVEVTGHPGLTYEFLPADLSLMLFKVGRVSGAVCYPGQVDLFAHLGKVRLDFTYDQKCD